jgi:hypothetical protein
MLLLQLLFCATIVHVGILVVGLSDALRFLPGRTFPADSCC